MCKISFLNFNKSLRRIFIKKSHDSIIHIGVSDFFMLNIYYIELTTWIEGKAEILPIVQSMNIAVLKIKSKYLLFVLDISKPLFIKIYVCLLSVVVVVIFCITTGLIFTNWDKICLFLAEWYSKSCSIEGSCLIMSRGK